MPFFHTQQVYLTELTNLDLLYTIFMLVFIESVLFFKSFTLIRFNWGSRYFKGSYAWTNIALT